MKLIDKQLLDDVSRQAQKSDRLRMNYNFHQSLDDKCHRFLNAVEPGTVIPVHRHRETSEDVVVLRGRAEEVIYDDNGAVIERCIMTPGGIEPGSFPAVHVPMGQYHTCKSMESGTVIIEFKNGKYDPRTTEDVLEGEE